MKRKYFYLLALAALTLGSCSNENDLFGESPNGGPQGEKQQVTFLFPGTAQGVVPYAPGDPIASEAENKITTLDVYVFGADKLATANPKYLLEDVVKLKDTDLTADADALKATLSFVGTNDKCLYFVANGGDQTALADYELGVTDTLAFVGKQTRLMGKGLVKAPLLMTGRYNFKKTAEGGMDLTGPHQVTMNRRVARFDIINDSEESTLQIEKILIKNTRPGAYLFAFGDTERPAYDIPLIAELMEIDFISYPTANVGETPSVFYVYPTMVDGETSFELKGHSTQSGEQMVQPVKMRKKQTGTEEEIKLLPINPNTRYIINILNAGSATIDATITVKEWQVGQGLDVEAGHGQVKMTLAAPIADVTLTESKRLDVPSTTSVAAFDILVAADTEWEIVEQNADLSWIAITNRPTVASDNGTPGDLTDDTPAEVGKKFTIEITEKNPSSDPREKVLHIRNVQRPSIVQALTVVQAGSLTGFKVTGDRLEDNTLALFTEASVNVLTLALPGGVDAFECETAESWITLEQPTVVTRVPTSITGTKLQVSVAAHTGDAERIGTFTITVGKDENAATQIITVKQAPRNLGSIVVQAVGMVGGKVTYPAAEQNNLTLLVKALTEWEVEAFDIDELGVVTATPTAWITNGTIELTETTNPKVNYNGKYNFTITANTGSTDRKSRMIFTNAFNNKIKTELTITQAVAPTFTVTLTGKELKDGDTFPVGSEERWGQFPYFGKITTSNNAPADLSYKLSESGWINLIISSGGLSLEVRANNTGAKRTSTLTITLKNALAPQVFTVEQAAAVAPTFTVSGTGLTGTALAMGHEAVTATEYTVAPSNNAFSTLTVEKQATGADWLTYDPATLINDGKFTLAATANDTGAERTATVTINLTGATPTVITVTQAAAPAPVASFTVSGKDLAGTAPAMTLAMTNAEFTTQTYTVALTNATADALSIDKQEGANWLSMGGSEIATDGTFTLSADANDTGAERTATVTINLTGATPTVITITQPGA